MVPKSPPKPPTPPDPPKIANLKILLHLPEFRDVITSDGKVVNPTAKIFTQISEAIGADPVLKMKPKNIYTVLKLNRHSIHADLLRERNIDVQLNTFLGNCSANDSVNNDTETEFTIDVTDVWNKMAPEEVHYRLKDRQQRAVYKLKRRSWTNVLYAAIYKKTEIPCALAFKSVNMTVSSFFATVSAGCSECGCAFEGKIIHAPIKDERIIMECMVYNFDPDVQHTKKRQLNGELREIVGKEIVEGNMLACMWRRKRANELIKNVGDPEPAHLPRNNTIKKVKQQQMDKQLGLPTNDIFMNLRAMKYDPKFEGAIRSIGLDPIFVHYWTTEQMAIFDKFPDILYIDATGSVIKKIQLPNGKLCPHLYLYLAVGQVGNKTMPLFQGLSSVQNSNAILFLINEFLRQGALQRPSFPGPKEVVTDFDKALLGAVSRACALQPSLKMYMNTCWDLVCGKGTTIPRCLLRLDICHFMNIIARWKCFTGKPSKVRKMFLRSVGMLRRQNTFEEFEKIAKAILTLSLSQNQGCGTLADTARSELTDCITGKNVTDQVDIPETSESEEEVPPEKSMDDDYLTATNIWKWSDQLYKDCLSALQNETESHDVNGFHCPGFAKKLKNLLPYFPLFSEVMRDIFGYGSTNATSAAVESEFNDMKNRVFRNIGLPLRLDKFVARHLASIPGKLKLAMAGQYQQINLDALSVPKDDVPYHKPTDELCPALLPNVAQQKTSYVSNDDDVQMDAMNELNEEQNWRNKNDKPIKILKDTNADPHDSEDPSRTVEQNLMEQTCEHVTVTDAVSELGIKQPGIKKNKKYNKKVPYTEPFPGFVSSHAKYTRLTIMVNGNLCPYVRDGLNTIVVINTCGFDSLCQIFANASLDNAIYREAMTKMQSGIFSCVNILISNGLCVKLYQERARVLKDLCQLECTTGRNGVIKINADSNLYNLATYLLENYPSCVQRTKCLNCGAKNERKYPVQTTNFDILCNEGISHLSQAIDKSRVAPRSCCGKVPCIEVIYGPYIVCEVDSGKITKTALAEFPNQIIPANARTYRLAGVIAYTGSRRVKSTGHYIAYLKTEDSWLMYNDNAKHSEVVDYDAAVEAHICVYVIT